jgi:hypothetical protein
MHSLCAMVALIAFLLVELISFLRGHSLTTIMVRGLGVYAGVWVLGLLVVKVLKEFAPASGEDADEDGAGSKIDINVDDSFDGKKDPEYNSMEDIKAAVAKNPKKIATAIKKMMSK